jgi:signal transduction histidine kinase/ligand-binding sensor domain-containing protein
MRRRLGLLFVILAVVFSRSAAQVAEYSFKQLTVDQGLSQNSVYTILQDRSGFMWFGTKDGLNRYDGYRFVIFKHNPSDSTSLADNSITTLYEDRRGRMWVSTTSALHVFDQKTERFYRVLLVDLSSNGQSPVTVNAITEDDEGNLWLGTIASGLIRLTVSEDYPHSRATSAKFFVHDPQNPKSLYNNYITALYFDSHKVLWVGTLGRLQSLNPRELERGFENHRIRASLGRNDPEVYCLYEDAHRVLWLGTSDGLVRYDRESRRMIIYPWKGDDFVGQNRSIRAIGEDGRGRLWLGNFGRLVYFDRQTEQYRTVPRHVEETSDLFRTGTVQIRRDRSGALWFGSNGHGVFRHDAILSRFQSFTKATSKNIGWSGHSVRSLYEDSERRLWIGSYGGLYVANPSRTAFTRAPNVGDFMVRSITQDPQGIFWFASADLIRFDAKTNNVRVYHHNPREAKSIMGNEVAGVLQDHAGTLWVVAGGVLSKFERTSGRFTQFAFADPAEFISTDPTPIGMYEDHRSRIWLATEKGLFVFDAATNRFKRYVYEPGNEHSLSYSVTRCITPDPLEPERILWIGTAGGGLNRLDLQTEQFTAFTEEDGLPNNVVYGILGDSTGNLWLSTNKGLARFNPRTRTFQTYLSQDGLQSNEYNSGAYHKSRRGEMFFGGINGFDVFDPATVYANSYVPEVVITELRLFNKPVTLHDARVRLTEPISLATAVTFSYSQNVFSLTFVSLDYTAPEKNLYQYMLEGFDPDFGPASTIRTATYTNLDPGEYTFRVRGSNSDGVWSEKEASLVITVLPPFWMTWWFRTVLVVIILALGPIIYYRRVTALKREHARQREFSRRLIESQESERKRIAAELHDSLGQNLLVMKNRAVLGLQDAQVTGALRDGLTEISNTASATLKEVREISHNLRPYELDRFGVTEAIRSVVEKVQASSAIVFTTAIDDFDGLLEKEFEINLYRAVQECLNNIMKHAEATQAFVGITKNNGFLVVTVRDNGKGFEQRALQSGEQKTVGLGLSSLEERMRILGGSLTITSNPGSGTTISMTIPLRKQPDGAP